MKYQEGTAGSKQEFAAFIKRVFPELFAGRLAVEGNKVAIPDDAELDFKVKYDVDGAGGSFTVKVSWDNDVFEEDEEEAEEENEWFK